jgi:hypothetical protein
MRPGRVWPRGEWRARAAGLLQTSRQARASGASRGGCSTATQLAVSAGVRAQGVEHAITHMKGIRHQAGPGDQRHCADLCPWGAGGGKGLCLLRALAAGSYAWHPLRHQRQHLEHAGQGAQGGQATGWCCCGARRRGLRRSAPPPIATQTGRCRRSGGAADGRHLSECMLLRKQLRFPEIAVTHPPDAHLRGVWPSTTHNDHAL